MDALWKTATVDGQRAQALATAHDLPIRVARWLCARDMTDEEITEWLTPGAERSVHCTYRDMNKAVDRVFDAVRRGERICVVGDYDVDGVTASAILASALQYIGADWRVIIPHRIHDGYGLSDKLVDRALDMDAGLLITVDNGIRALEAIRYATGHKLDVIVTDHHEPGDELPTDSTAVLHWAVSDDPNASLLSGAAVSLQLAIALLDGWNGDKSLRQQLSAWHMGLAALGAIADMMPMRRINRHLVLQGLANLRVCGHPGWVTLCEAAGVDVNQLDDVKVSWSIAPRINAAGRIGSAEAAFNLFMASDANLAVQEARLIEAWNDQRKVETDRAFAAALLQSEETVRVVEHGGLVVSGPWHLGVVGIVAAKLVNSFHRPTIVFADDGSDVLKGSGRSPKGFPLYEAVLACEHLLEHFGGHEAAVGCAVHRSQLSAFRDAFQTCVAEMSEAYASGENAGVIADDYLPLSEISMEALSWLNRFRPFGTDNPQFTFYVGPVELVRNTPMGNGSHGRFRVKEGADSVDMIWFQMPEEAKSWPSGAYIGAIVELTENTWQGVTRPQLRVIEAYRLSRPLRREDFGLMYRLLRAHRIVRKTDLPSLSERHTSVETEIIFEAFVELGFAQFEESAYHVVEQVVHRDLRDSFHYQKHLRSARLTEGR